MGQCVCGLQRRHDALDTRDAVESCQGFAVVCRDILHASRILEPRVLRADPGIIQTRRNRMGFRNLPVFILHQVGAVAVQDARGAGRQRRGMLASADTLTAGLDAVNVNSGILQERVEQAYGVGAAADTGDQCIRQFAALCQRLGTRFPADDALEVANQHGIGCGPATLPII